MASFSEQLPNLGIGLGFRDRYHTDVFQRRQSIDFLEITADHFFEPTSSKRKQLHLLRDNFPLIPHGLALSLGSAEGLDESYVSLLAEVARAVEPPWWSEHIAFTRAGGVDIGHLTPLPKTRAALDVLRMNIRRVREAIDYPLILENITETIHFPMNEMDDASFLGHVLEESDCGLLLDVTNLYTNSVNHRFDPLQVLWRLPADRIVQLHFVGGHWDGDQLIDSHSAATPPEIWSLLEEVVKYAPVKGVILERDEHLPPMEDLVVELERARGLVRRHRPEATACKFSSPAPDGAR